MSARRIYISGAIKNDPDYRGKFATHEHKLSVHDGYEVVNPCTLPHPEDATYEDFMREDIRAMLDCDEIGMIPGWELSAGAKLEFLVATMCGITVKFL